MNKEILAGLFRHLLTVGSGFLVTQGLIDGSAVESFTGFGLGLFAIGWGVVAKESIGWETVRSVARHGLTLASGAAVAQGWVSPEVGAEIVGGLLALIGAGWSIAEKRRAA